MKKILFILIAISSVGVYAQQEIQSSQFMLNPFLLNPAYSSVDDNTDVKLGYRYQWTGIEGAPETYYLSVHTPIGKPRWGRTHPGDFHNWHGTGLVLMQDKLGPYTNLRFNANYSYNLKLTDGTEYGYNHHDGLRIALGAFVGMNSYRVDTDILGTSKTGYGGYSGGAYVDNDLALTDDAYITLPEQSTQSVIDLSLGGMLYYEDAFYLGFSSTQLLESDLNLTEDADLSRHYFVSGLAKLQFSEQLYIIPSAIMKMVKGAPMSANFNIRADLRDNFYAGIGYRTGDAITAMLGAQIRWGEKIKNFRVDKHRYIMYVYYSYDFTTSRLGRGRFEENSGGAHEVTLGFLLPPQYTERNAEDTWKGFKKANRGKFLGKHF